MKRLIALCLNWNGYYHLKKMIPSLKLNLANIGISHEIWVRDNGSTDKSVEHLERHHPDVNILKIDHNRYSFSDGVNSLFEAANPNDDDVLLLINNDIEFRDDQSLKNMLTTMERTGAAVVGAKLLYKNGTISHNGVIFSPKYGNMPWHHREGQRPVAFDNEDREFQAVTAACSLVKVKNFKEAGMLNTDLRWAFEDIDLCLNISLNQGEGVVCCGKTNIIHVTSASLKKNPVHKLCLGRNVEVFKEKWFGKYQIDHDLYLKDKNYKVV